MHVDDSLRASDVPTCRVGIDLTSVDDVRSPSTSRRSVISVGCSPRTKWPVPRGRRAVGRLTGGAVRRQRGCPQGPPADGARPEWRDIEVHRHASGACDLVLHGGAAALAAAQGIDEMSVSLSHEAGLAVAVVAACCRPEAPARPVLLTGGYPFDAVRRRG